MFFACVIKSMTIYNSFKSTSTWIYVRYGRIPIFEPSAATPRMRQKLHTTFHGKKYIDIIIHHCISLNRIAAHASRCFCDSTSELKNHNRIPEQKGHLNCSPDNETYVILVCS